MIYQFIKDQLNSVPELADKVFPTGVCIDDVDGPFVVYTMKKRTPVKDLSGKIHHYIEEILVDFLGDLYDELHELYCNAEAALNVSNLDTGNGEYIFSVSCESTDQDSFDPDTTLLRRAMLVSICWCPI